MLNKKEYPTLNEKHRRAVTRLANLPTQHRDFPGVNYRLYRATQEAKAFLSGDPQFDCGEFKKALDRTVKLNRALWKFLIKVDSAQSQYKNN